MTISDSEAVKYGLLVMYAEDMYTEGAIAPSIDRRIKQQGWEAIAYLTAKDSIFPPGQKQLMQPGFVFYGFLARNIADHSKYAAVIRGTSGITEWIIDAEFEPIPNPHEPGTKVEKGFWDVYETMNLTKLDGSVINNVAAKGIANTIGAGQVVIAGHSLGSALATYLSLETAQLLGPRVSACMFASPRTGDKAWANFYDTTVSDYRLFNYVLDAVPNVPFDFPPDIQYSTLSKATIIQPSSAQADIRLDLACNHHVICYCAMLDYEATLTSPPQPVGNQTWFCVIGPAKMSFNREGAISLAAMVTHLDAAKPILEMLKSRLHWTGRA